MFVVITTNRAIGPDTAQEDPVLLDKIWDIAGKLDAEGRAAARDMYSDDTARLRRLEDKLSGQNALAALLLTPLVAVLLVAVHRSSWVALAAAALAFGYLAAAVYLVSAATQPTQTAMPHPTHLLPDDPAMPFRRYTYEQLRAVPFNAPRGWKIVNAITGAQRCLFLAASLLIVSALLLAPGSFGSYADKPLPKPSPTQTP
jgi:hypothetical protein